MNSTDTSISILQLQELTLNLAQELPFLKLLILFGSRATGEYNKDSDYDFALLYDETMYKGWKSQGGSWFQLYTIFENTFNLPNEAVDLVNLNRCPKILAHVIATEGKLVYEKQAGEYDTFLKNSLISAEEMKKIRQQQRQSIEQKLQSLGA